MATQTMTMVEEETKIRKLSDKVNSEGEGEGDEPVDEPDSSKPNNNGVLLGAQRIMNTQYSQTLEQSQENLEEMMPQQGNVMGVGGGVGDDAVDVTYSTKPDNQNYNLGSIGFQTNTTGFQASTTEFATTSSTTGSIMGVGGGVGDNAVDVTYSTKPDNKFAKVRSITTKTTTTSGYGVGFGQNISSTQVSTGGTVMGIGGGVEDQAVDVTYSTKPDNAGIKFGREQIASIATTTTSVTGEDISNLDIYNRATILQDKVQHIIQKEIQPIIKTVYKPIIQKEIQPKYNLLLKEKFNQL